MKLYVTIVLLVHISLASCRPQSVQIEKQNLHHVRAARSKEKRGSEEETRRILQEINRINIAMGYIRPSEFAYPRVASDNGYFYPRQQFRPEFLTKPKINSQYLRNFNLQRAINPFYAQDYYYPTPYLQVPSNGQPLTFKSNKLYYPYTVYAPYNAIPMTKKEELKNKTVRLGKIVVLDEAERSPKAIESAVKKPAVKEKNIIKLKIKTVRKESEEEEEEEENAELIDQIVRIIVPEAAAIADAVEEEEKRENIPSTPKIPPLKNDKYLNLDLKHQIDDDDDDDDEEIEESRKIGSAPPPPAPNSTRALSFLNSIERIQNLTSTFTFNRNNETLKKSEEVTSSTQSPEDEYKEEEKEEAMDDMEELKSPFTLFPFGPKQQLQTFKEGGIIIQRLRVRHGGIAIAGPGGVATAGSGGTAIVGPSGIAITHPRGLAIGGPGARIYAVPESEDLEKLALTHKARNLDHVGVEERNFRFEQVDDSVRLPYLGGAKGQVLEIRQRPDGTIFSRILMDETKKDPQTEEFLNQKSEANSFEANLMKIQEAAADLVRIQEVFKQQGKLSTEQRKLYSQSLENLGISAQKLAKIEGTDDNVRLLLEEPQGDRKKSKDSKKKPENIQFPPFYQLNKKDEDCEEGVVLEEGETNSTLTTTVEPSTTVKPITTSSSPPVTSSSTTTTKKPSITIIQGTNTATVQSNNNDVEEETSVAEAKPVGVAISGVGGVASSKPVGTAVVGPGGLAIARPQATAIAGIKPSDYSSLGLPLPTKLKNLNARDSTSLPSKGKYGLVNIGTDDDQTQFLVGPEFLAEARLSDKGIDSDGEEEFDTEDKVENEDSKTMEGENSRRQSTIEKEKDDVNELDSNKHTESSDNLQFPFGIEYGKHPQFPPAYDNFFAYQSPYFLPPNAYVPVPINNQYLQRGASNAVLRYPSYSGYSQFPGYSNNNGLQVSPFRLFYAQ